MFSLTPRATASAPWPHPRPCPFRSSCSLRHGLTLQSTTSTSQVLEVHGLLPPSGCGLLSLKRAWSSVPLSAGRLGHPAGLPHHAHSPPRCLPHRVSHPGALFLALSASTCSFTHLMLFACLRLPSPNMLHAYRPTSPATQMAASITLSAPRAAGLCLCCSCIPCCRGDPITWPSSMGVSIRRYNFFPMFSLALPCPGMI